MQALLNLFVSRPETVEAAVPPDSTMDPAGLVIVLLVLLTGMIVAKIVYNLVSVLSKITHSFVLMALWAFFLALVLPFMVAQTRSGAGAYAEYLLAGVVPYRDLFMKVAAKAYALLFTQT